MWHGLDHIELYLFLRNNYSRPEIKCQKQMSTKFNCMNVRENDE